MFDENGDFGAALSICVISGSAPPARPLDVQTFWAQNDTVIAPAEPRRFEAATQTILIVDDDRSVADTFARMLKLEGFGVATALSADAGLDAGPDHDP